MKRIELYRLLIALLSGVLVFQVALFMLMGPKSAGCDDGVQLQRCFADAIEERLDRDDLDGAFDALIEFSLRDKNFATACHGNVHRIGEVVYERFAQGERINYTPKMSYCGYGFFHGFAEAMTLQMGGIKEVADFCRSLDAELHGEALGGTTACFHGIGHGAVDGSDPRDWGDPHAMVRVGIALCAELPDTDYARYVCNAGVYNAIELLSMDPTYRLEALAVDPFGFCNAEPRALREPCYTNMLPAVLRLAHDDIASSSRYILERISVPGDMTIDGFRVDEMVISALFHEYIRLHPPEQEDVLRALPICRSLPAEHLARACVTGLSGGHMKYMRPETAHAYWTRFCGSDRLADIEAHACYRHVLNRIRLWHSETEARVICRSTPAPYRTYCDAHLLEEVAHE